MKNSSSSSPQRGFTLIELLIVIMIIVILSAISMGGYGYVTRKQADSKATIQIGLLSKALEEYKLDNGGISAFWQHQQHLQAALLERDSCQLSGKDLSLRPRSQQRGPRLD